jgi:hypothetical protein
MMKTSAGKSCFSMGLGSCACKGSLSPHEEIRFIRHGFKNAQASFPAVAVQSPAA